MKLNLLFKLSLRHFFTRDNKGSHHLRGAALGIGIAIVPVIIVFVAGNGLIEGITERYQELSSGQIQIRGIFDDETANDILNELSFLSDIQYAGELMEEYGLIHSNGVNEGTIIRGLPADMYLKDEGFRRNLSIEAGEFDISDSDSIMVSNELAKKLSLKPGDSLKLIAHRSFGARTLYRPVTFTVKGIFSTGYYELDATSVYISSKRLVQLFGKNIPRYIVVKTSLDAISRLLKNLPLLLDGDVAVMPWYRINSSMYDNFSSTKSSLMIIMLLIVAIAGLSVSSSVYMLVMEQKEEIAFLKAVGMTNNAISKVFIFSGGITGLIGGAVGILAGLLTGIHINEILKGIEIVINGLNIAVHRLIETGHPIDHISIMGGDFYLDRIPVIIRAREILLIYTVGVMVSIGGALIPSVKASSIPPLEMISKK